MAVFSDLGEHLSEPWMIDAQAVTRKKEEVGRISGFTLGSVEN